MARAVEGMKAEQDSMLFFYVALIATFSVAIFAMFFLLMTNTGGYVCCAFFACQILIMCNRATHIYNRFKFDAVDAGSFDSTSPEVARRISSANISHEVSSNPLYIEARKSLAAGFLMMRTRGQGIFSSDSWARKYFVLKHMHIRYYNSKKEYEVDEEASVNPRPIDMHFLVFRELKTTDGKLDNKFCIEPTRPDGDELDRYVLICEREDEYETWKRSLETVMLGAKASAEEAIVEGDGFTEIK
jgi:hypothetical protein